METSIHPTAIVHPKAQLGKGVIIGPNSYIGPYVTIGDNTEILGNVYIGSYTRIGKNCKIYPGAVLGMDPQDKSYKGERSWVIIGDNNIIREYVTIHRATGEDQATIVGNNNFIMAYTHIAHNCKVGNNVILSNYVGLSGHVIVEDRAVLGGMVGVHQFVRIGSYVMVGGYSKVSQDVPPYMLVFGNPAKVYSVNVVGLIRNGFSREEREEISRLFKLLYLDQRAWNEKMEILKELASSSPRAKLLYDFLRAPSKRGILRKLSREE